jgi:tight adherence protein B
MGILLAAIGIAILCYIGFVLLFPKAVPEDAEDYTRAALNRLYEENQSAGDEQKATILRDHLDEEPALVRAVLGSAIMRPIYTAGLQAGYQNNMQQLIVIMVAVFFAAVVGFSMLGLGPLGLVAAAVLGYYAPYRHCMKKVRKRNRKFLDQFPDALDMIVRSVRSGFPLSVALQMLAENSENPVKEEFRMVVDDIALGRSMNQALSRLASRLNESDIRFFVVVLSVQQETGGNLAEIISNLSNIIRKRKQLRHKIHAMTSEGRATAWVLSLLPVFVFVALWFLQPDYLRAFWTDPLGMIFFASTIGLIGTCAIVVKHMINVDI